MSMVDKIKSILRRKFAPIINSEVQRALNGMLPVLPQLIDFQNSSEKDRQSYYDHTKNSIENLQLYASLKDRLITAGVPVREENIDLDAFNLWLKKFRGIKNQYINMGNVFIEKCMEHYLTYKYLNMKRGDTYIDIAAAGSNWANIVNRIGINSYRLDLSYKAGINGINIGCDAGRTVLPEQFADCLSLHCAYECFMGDTDINFVKEASRILRPGGRYAIAPLYLDDNYFITTSPYCNQAEIIIEPAAKKVWRDDTYKVPFSRHYSPESFSDRIYSIIPKDMTGEIIYIRNIEEIINHYNDQRIYCFFLFFCRKI